MSASARIPPIAQPFVSDKAKKTLDLVLYLPTFPRISRRYKFHA
jgi:hypothetical protein